ncbi:MAG: glycine cleavage system protein GcvH [Candidatus Schekmanbacteria bacterium]|nr:MAG: glycine cleavage system protein GcvH [Candidatus Schekmanbacteria bacterium]
MNCPEDLKYTKEHEWARVESENEVKVGITDYAQQELGDIVFVELPEEGAEVTQGEVFGSIESVKAVSDLYSPVTGKVSAVNGRIADEPELVNSDPYGEGWLLSVEIDDKSQLDSLLDASAYISYVEEEKKE